MSPPTPRLTAATLAELEKTTGYEWFVKAPQNELVFPERIRGLLRDAAKELHSLEPQLPRVFTTLQRRFLKHTAWLAEALGEFEEAGRLWEMQGEKQEAEWLRFQAQLTRELKTLLPEKHYVCALRPLVKGGSTWALLALADGTESPWEPRLVVVQKQGHHWKSVAERLFKPDDPRNVHLCTLNGEILVVIDRLGGSWQPTDCFCYRFRNGKLHKTGELFSEHGTRIRRMHGRWTLSTFHCIGICPSHGDQPRWLEIFQQSQNGWQLASARFPELFRDYPRQIRSLLKRYPKDDVLPVYLHWTERLLQGKHVGPPPQEHAQKIDA